jgi:hypothetical protein
MVTLPLNRVPAKSRGSAKVEPISAISFWKWRGPIVAVQQTKNVFISHRDGHWVNAMDKSKCKRCNVRVCRRIWLAYRCITASHPSSSESQTSPLYECKRNLIQTTIVGEAKEVKHRENKEQSDPSKAPIREGQSKQVDTESHATRYLGPVKRGSS